MSIEALFHALYGFHAHHVCGAFNGVLSHFSGSG
ncbi:hypothetical protein [Caudoviricetes sp.]|nr:hypothetical protein [Caudoviricetes sp.]